jgi:hypothetical protein
MVRICATAPITIIIVAIEASARARAIGASYPSISGMRLLANCLVDDGKDY